MTIIFIAGPGSDLETCHTWAVKCALRRSECKVVAVADRRVDEEEWVPFSDVEAQSRIEFPQLWKTYNDGIEWSENPALVNLDRNSFMRWAIAATYASASPSLFPITIPDWDMMVAWPMEEPYQKLAHLEAALIGWNPLFFRSAAYLSDAVKSWHDWTRAGRLFQNDMMFWAETTKVGAFGHKVGGATLENGAYIDRNIHCDVGTTFVGDATSRRVTKFGEEHELPKRVIWHGAKPYFVLAKYGSLYPAYMLHCWGTYKRRIPEVAGRILAQ